MDEQVGVRLREWAAGGLTEPGNGKAGEAMAGSADGSAPQASAHSSQSPGSVSSWAEVSEAVDREGVPVDLLAATARELFRGRKPSELAPDECAKLWLTVQERAKAAVA